MMDCILYSFRRCPYAIRTRMVLRYSGVNCEVREVLLKDKPSEMLLCSPKATVPVLQVVDGLTSHVIDESLDIIHWTLDHADPDGWRNRLSQSSSCLSLVKNNDEDFKYYLDRYKYADRYPEHTQSEYFESAQVYLLELDARLVKTRYLTSDRLSWVDVALFPFIRQFAFVNKGAFDQLELPRLHAWLDWFLASPLFISVMNKNPVWQTGQIGYRL